MWRREKVSGLQTLKDLLKWTKKYEGGGVKRRERSEDLWPSSLSSCLIVLFSEMFKVQWGRWMDFKGKIQ